MLLLMLLLLLFVVVDAAAAVAAILSSVPTSETLPPFRVYRHSHFRPHPRLNPHRGPAPKGPQKEASDRWWAAIRRKHCTAAESLRWCSLVPVRIQHAQDDTSLCPLLTTMFAKSRSQTGCMRVPSREQTAITSLPFGFEGFDQNCPGQGRRQEHRD